MDKNIVAFLSVFFLFGPSIIVLSSHMNSPSIVTQKKKRTLLEVYLSGEENNYIFL